ncbi:hypothetical protein R3P38DRAFT_2794833 [Favolaschia claudopus]|uniref:Uncharacterized protein n=1 Tax=Favolaschia claudopus TaxID=2862362 RepID=A0AAW0A7U6_9AGAR
MDTTASRILTVWLSVTPTHARTSTSTAAPISPRWYCRHPPSAASNNGDLLLACPSPSSPPRAPDRKPANQHKERHVHVDGNTTNARRDFGVAYPHCGQVHTVVIYPSFNLLLALFATPAFPIHKSSSKMRSDPAPPAENCCIHPHAAIESAVKEGPAASCTGTAAAEEGQERVASSPLPTRQGELRRCTHSWLSEEGKGTETDDAIDGEVGKGIPALGDEISSAEEQESIVNRSSSPYSPRSIRPSHYKDIVDRHTGYSGVRKMRKKAVCLLLCEPSMMIKRDRAYAPRGIPGVPSHIIQNLTTSSLSVDAWAAQKMTEDVPAPCIETCRTHAVDQPPSSLIEWQLHPWDSDSEKNLATWWSQNVGGVVVMRQEIGEKNIAVVERVEQEHLASIVCYDLMDLMRRAVTLLNLNHHVEIASTYKLCFKPSK